MNFNFFSCKVDGKIFLKKKFFLLVQKQPEWYPCYNSNFIMQNERFWLLLSLKLTGEATVEELEEFALLLKHHPELGWQAQLISQMWVKKEDKSGETVNNFYNMHLQRLSNHPDIGYIPQQYEETDSNLFLRDGDRKQRYRWIYILTGAAASVAIMVLLYYNAHLFPGSTDTTKSIPQNTVVTQKGSKSKIQLPDGTDVWLNADSKISYDENFLGDVREITLTGEAYFDVVKDVYRPFIIHTRTIDIRVLGTAFNVKAYDTDATTETSLIRGSVEITLHNSPEKKIILKPHEKLRVNNTSLEYITDSGESEIKPIADDMNIVVGKIHFQKKDSMALDALWTKNKLVFDAESLEQVMRKIERWYNVRVNVLVDENAKSTQYSGIFENETLPEVMEALKFTGNFSYSIDKDVVTIK